MFKDCINHTSREWSHVQRQEHTHNSNPIPGPEESAGAKESGEAGCMSCLCFACCCFVKLWIRDLQASVATMLYYTSIRCFLFLPPIIHMLQDFETIRILYNMIFHTGTVTPESKEVISTIQKLLIFSHLTNPSHASPMHPKNRSITAPPRRLNRWPQAATGAPVATQSRVLVQTKLVCQRKE